MKRVCTVSHKTGRLPQAEENPPYATVGPGTRLSGSLLLAPCPGAPRINLRAHKIDFASQTKKLVPGSNLSLKRHSGLQRTLIIAIGVAAVCAVAGYAAGNLLPFAGMTFDIERGIDMKTAGFVVAVVLLLLVLAADVTGYDINRPLRFVLLVSFTALATSLFALVLTSAWKSGRSDARVEVAAFKVIDPTGKITNADSGLASLLVSRVDALSAKIKAASQTLSTRQEQPAAAGTAGIAFPQSVPSTTQGALENLFLSGGSAVTAPDLKIQGVDLTGLLSWLGKSLQPKTKSVNFTAHIEEKRITIAGDVSALGFENQQTVWLPDAGPSVPEAVDSLAYRLFQLNLPEELAHLRALEPVMFRDLMAALNKSEDPLRDSLSLAQRRQDASEAHEQMIRVLAVQTPRVTLHEAAGALARRANRLQQSLRHYEEGLELALSANDEPKQKQLRSIILAVRAEMAVGNMTQTAAIARTRETRIVRRSVDDLDAAQIATLRAGFAATAPDGTRILDAAGSIFRDNYWRFSGLGKDTNLFLPWNRAFLIATERLFRQQVPGFEYACWNFDGPDELPQIYATEKVEGADNPLFFKVQGKDVSPSPVNRLVEGLAQPDLLDVLALPDLAQFSARLEILSNTRHVAVGLKHSRGTSAVETAGFDPVTYAHLCAVDRLWSQWQSLNTPTYPDDVLEVELTPFEMKVRDVLDLSKFDITYP